MRGKNRLSSLERMRMEIESQAESLRVYAEGLSSIPGEDPSSLVFAGSGDSYSAALWAQELSVGKAGAYDPFELALSPSRVKGKDVVILSVSGKTRSNIFLAEKIRGVANRLIAVTGSRDSPLSRMCDDTILLEYRQAGGLTAGTASYTATLLACSHLLMPRHSRLDRELNSVRSSLGLENAIVTKDSFTMFVGSGLDYPLAMYGGLKINEVLGLKSIHCTPEQLVHAIVFSLDKEKDRVVVLNPSANRRFSEIKQVLSDDGFLVYSLDVPRHDPLIESLQVAFQLQYFAYDQAEKMGLEECAFLSKKEVLDISSNLIY